MKIRKAAKRDLDGIYPVFAELVNSEEKNSKKAVSLFKYLNVRKKQFEKNSKSELMRDVQKKNSVVFVAEDGGRVIGYISGNFTNSKNPFYNSVILGYFKHIAVLRKYHRKGVAKELYKNLEDWLKKKKCDFVYLEVFSANHAVKIFEKLGYKVATYKMWKKLK